MLLSISLGTFRNNGKAPVSCSRECPFQVLISYVCYIESLKFKGKGQVPGRLQMRTCVDRGEFRPCGLKKEEPKITYKGQQPP